MPRYLNPDGTFRPADELVAIIMEYEHALEHVTDPHDRTCADCQRVARGALDGVGEDDFLSVVWAIYP